MEMRIQLLVSNVAQNIHVQQKRYLIFVCFSVELSHLYFSHLHEISCLLQLNSFSCISLHVPTWCTVNNNTDANVSVNSTLVSVGDDSVGLNIAVSYWF